MATNNIYLPHGYTGSRDTVLARMKHAVSVDFGVGKKPSEPRRIHFTNIENTELQDGTKNFDIDEGEIHLIHQKMGFGPVVTDSEREYVFLLTVVELPVTLVYDNELPSYKEEDEIESSYSSPCCYRSHVLAKRMQEWRKYNSRVVANANKKKKKPKNDDWSRWSDVETTEKKRGSKCKTYENKYHDNKKKSTVKYNGEKNWDKWSSED